MGHIIRNLTRSAFVAGFARSLDLFGAQNQPLPPRRPELTRSDAQAIASDWRAVGGDVVHASETLAADVEREELTPA